MGIDGGNMAGFTSFCKRYRLRCDRTFSVQWVWVTSPVSLLLYYLIVFFPVSTTYVSIHTK